MMGLGEIGSVPVRMISEDWLIKFNCILPLLAMLNWVGTEQQRKTRWRYEGGNRRWIDRARRTPSLAILAFIQFFDPHYLALISYLCTYISSTWTVRKQEQNIAHGSDPALRSAAAFVGGRFKIVTSTKVPFVFPTLLFLPSKQCIR